MLPSLASPTTLGAKILPLRPGVHVRVHTMYIRGGGQSGGGGTQEAFEKITTSGLVAFGLGSGKEKLK